MKNLLYIFCLLAIFSSNIFTQVPTDCDWNPCSASWVEEQSPLVGDTNGCGFLVFYKWRICEGATPPLQVEIIKIELLSGGNCQYTNNTAIVNQAIKALLISSVAYFRLVPDIPFIVNVKIPGCLQRSIINGKINLTNIGCNTQCCDFNYRMIFTNGEMICTEQTNNQGQIACSTSTNQTCQTYCENMYIPINTPLYAQHFDTFIDCVQDTTYCRLNPIPPGPIPTFELKTAYYIDPPPYYTKKIMINYLIRRCVNSNEFEIRILNIQIISGVWNAYEWVRFSYRVIMKEICSLYGITPNRYDLGVYVKPCWNSRFTTDSPPFLFNIVPCESPNYCCYRHITVDCSLNQIVNVCDTPIVRGQETDCQTQNSLCGEWYCDVVEEFSPNTGPLPKCALVYEFVEVKKDYLILVNPNPSNDKIRISFHSSEIGQIYLDILNNIGELIFTETYKKNNTSFESEMMISNLNSGIYFCKITINDKVYNYHFVILK